MILVMDIQGFEVENRKYIVKEMAAYNGKQLCHYVFKPPFPYDMLSEELQKKVYSQTVNSHGIQWETGFTPLHLFGKILHNLCNVATYIHISGEEKANYLGQFTYKSVLNLEEAYLEKSTPTCLYHSNDYCICALSNVFKLYENCIMS